MPLPTDARRLLDEVESRFEQPDWPTVKSWLAEQGTRERGVTAPTVPTSLDALDHLIALAPGDLVTAPLLLRSDQATLPAGSRYESSVHALGDLVIEEGVVLDGDLNAAGTLTWRGGSDSRGRTISATVIRLDKAGRFDGSVLCDQLDGGIPAGTVVRGLVVVAEGDDQPITVGEQARLGGIYSHGDVRVQAQAHIGQIMTHGAVELGAGTHVGTVQAGSVRVGPQARVTRIESSGTVTLEPTALVDSVHASGDIHIGAGAQLTGHTIRSDRGTLFAEPGDRWHDQPEHWFYLLPDGSIVPYRRDERPEGSAVVALRTLSHELWHQKRQLAGES